LEESLAWCHLLYIQTKQEILIDYNWAAIHALACALKTRRIIRAREAKQIMLAGEAAFFVQYEK
jgi:hypothetical protein